MKHQYLNALLILLLAACGGSGGTPVTTGPDDRLGLSDQSSEVSNVTAILSTMTSGEVTSAVGTIDRENATISVGSLSGGYGAGDQQIVLSSGGAATITDQLDYAALVSIEQNTGTQLGVFGVPAVDVPSIDSATHVGEANIAVIDSDAAYDLMGTATLVLNFENQRADLTIDDLNGVAFDQAGTDYSVSEVAILEIENAQLTGNALEGGTFGLRSTTLSPLGENSTLEHKGGLFGPSAVESGGAFVVDDRTNGDLLLQGIYLAD